MYTLSSNNCLPISIEPFWTSESCLCSSIIIVDSVKSQVYYQLNRTHFVVFFLLLYESEQLFFFLIGTYGLWVSILRQMYSKLQIDLRTVNSWRILIQNEQLFWLFPFKSAQYLAIWNIFRIDVMDHTFWFSGMNQFRFSIDFFHLLRFPYWFSTKCICIQI